jgi:hypothetical protein
MLKKHQFSEPFLRPVDTVALNIPDYYDVIKEPMDFSTVEAKIRGNDYVSHL